MQGVPPGFQIKWPLHRTWRVCWGPFFWTPRVGACKVGALLQAHGSTLGVSTGVG